MLGTGGVIKAGAGTLNFANARSYAGNTTVTGGNLVLAQDNTANDASTVSIEAGAFLTLGAGVVDTVDKLFLAGVQQPAGDYTSANSGGRILGEGTLRVLSSPITDPYIGWISGFSLALDQVDTTDDPDGDGLNNLLEFVLNGNPSVADTSVLPTVAVNGANLELTYQRRKDSVTDIVQTVQWGTTLASWPGSAIIPATSATVAPVTVTVSAGVPSDTVTDTVKVAIPMTESGDAGRLFGRLQAVKP
ncbi:MAG: hypothetical protein MUE42_12045 [Opitutaceae bacterium]|nr:hypothetical protein [Opitutaceae bacterium]